MSYDFHIAASDRLDSKRLQDFLQQQGLLADDGSFERNNFLIYKPIKGEKQAICVCDVSQVIDPLDLDEVFATVVLAPKWFYRLCVPEATAKGDTAKVMNVAKCIAESCRGAVYDPQEEKVLFPKGQPKRYLAPSTDERINVIEMKWFLPPFQATSTIWKDLMRILRAICPEALPQRYGDYEPLQYKLQPGTEDQFYEFIQGEMQAGGLLFFKAKSPCFGGSIGFPTRTYRLEKNEQHVVSISLCFDARACVDARWSKVLSSLFVELSKSMAAVYAMAYVDENIILKKGGHLYYNSSYKTYPLLNSPQWVGIPKLPMWLNWFGRPYIAEVAPALAGYTVLETQQGIFLQMGNQPKTLNELQMDFPKLPERLLAHREYELMANGQICGWKYQDFFAEYIPEFE